MSTTKTKVVDTVLKNHKPFLINIGDYQDVLVQTRRLFRYFWLAKFASYNQASSNLVCIKPHKHPYFVRMLVLFIKNFFTYELIDKFLS